MIFKSIFDFRIFIPYVDRDFIANCVQNVCAQQLIKSYLQYEIFAHLERKWNNNWNECDECSLNLGISNSKGCLVVERCFDRD